MNLKKGSNGATRKTTTTKSVSSGPSEADSASVASSFNEEDQLTEKSQRRLTSNNNSLSQSQLDYCAVHNQQFVKHCFNPISAYFLHGQFGHF